MNTGVLAGSQGCLRPGRDERRRLSTQAVVMTLLQTRRSFMRTTALLFFNPTTDAILTRKPLHGRQFKLERLKQPDRFLVPALLGGARNSNAIRLALKNSIHLAPAAEQANQSRVRNTLHSSGGSLSLQRLVQHAAVCVPPLREVKASHQFKQRSSL